MGKKKKSSKHKSAVSKGIKEIKNALEVKPKAEGFVIEKIPENLRRFRFWGFLGGFCASIFALILLPALIFLYVSMNFSGMASWYAMGGSFVLILIGIIVGGFFLRRRYPSLVLGAGVGVGLAMILTVLAMIGALIVAVWAGKAMKV